MYISVKETAQNWGISQRRVRTLCAEGKIPGVIRQGRYWQIPENAQKPTDGRFKNAENILDIIEAKKDMLNKKRPLTEGEIQRLSEEFIIEYTYNSNAIEGNTLTLRETDMVLRGLTVDKKPLKDHIEAVGHKEAFDYVCELVKNKECLTEKIIKEIHYLVLADKRQDRGVYRRVPVRIMGAKNEPVQPYMIEESMRKLLENYNTNNEHIVHDWHVFILNLNVFILLSTATAEQTDCL